MKWLKIRVVATHMTQSACEIYCGFWCQPLNLFSNYFFALVPLHPVDASGRMKRMIRYNSCIMKSCKNVRIHPRSRVHSLTFLCSNNINTIFYYGAMCGNIKLLSAFIKKDSFRIIIMAFKWNREKKLKEILDLYFDLFYYLFDFFPLARRLSTLHFSFRECVIIKCSCMRNIILCINEI